MWIYGTAWKELRTAELVGHALQAGFRAFDKANQRKHYHEAGVGEAIAGWDRSELWLQTKYTFQAGQDHRLPYDPSAPIGEQVAQSFASSLEHLGTDYLDSYVLHGPSVREGLADADVAAWRAMEELQRSGAVRDLGVSNVSTAQLQALLELAEVKPSWVQNRCYAVTGWDADTRAVCRAHGIRYQGFSLLTANRKIWNHRVVLGLASERGCTPAQLVFWLARALGITPLTGTSDPRHMAADLQVEALDAVTVEQLVAL